MLMDSNYWIERWKDGATAFHENDVNPHLIKYWDRIRAFKNDNVFLPLCGKSVDIGWLLNKGLHVVGVELSEFAVTQLFLGLGIDPTITMVGDLKRYSHNNLDIFVGNIFNLSATELGPIDVIYDRAAFVAMPDDMRGRYAGHVSKISQKAAQLLITYRYDQSLVDGPPFSINHEELFLHYEKKYNLLLLESSKVPGGFRGKYEAFEEIWLLESR